MYIMNIVNLGHKPTKLNNVIYEGSPSLKAFASLSATLIPHIKE